MSAADEANPLLPNNVDHAVAALKAVTGAIPFGGSIIQELLGTTIKQQRVDRMASFLLSLEARVKALEANLVEMLTDEGFVELLEDALLQATRTSSNERREQLANLVANGMAPDAITHAESKHLLRILSELTDVEILFLRFEATHSQDFYRLHKDVLSPADSEGNPDADRSALKQSYMLHLRTLGLVRQHSEKNDDRSRILALFPGITPLGKLLLRTIGLP